MSKLNNDQQKFWMGRFGKEYVSRNSLNRLVQNNLGLFSKIFINRLPPKNCLEFGANIGANLIALKNLFPDLVTHGVEINTFAFNQLKKKLR